jgi:hypothetical protein
VIHATAAREQSRILPAPANAALAPDASQKEPQEAVVMARDPPSVIARELLSSTIKEFRNEPFRASA